MTTWETLAREASNEKLRAYVRGEGWAPAMREAAAAELRRRETSPGSDLEARWRPTEDQVTAALAKLEREAAREPGAKWLAAVPLAMPGKVHGVWEVGQVVEHPPGVWVGVNHDRSAGHQTYGTARDLASAAARKHLAGRPGTVGWAVVRPDGTWAVFEDF